MGKFGNQDVELILFCTCNLPDLCSLTAYIETENSEVCKLLGSFRLACSLAAELCVKAGCDWNCSRLNHQRERELFLQSSPSCFLPAFFQLLSFLSMSLFLLSLPLFPSLFPLSLLPPSSPPSFPFFHFLSPSLFPYSDGTNVQLYECSGADNQKWLYSNSDGTINGMESGCRVYH